MAFVYKSEAIPPSKNLTLGPGKYLSHSTYKFKENKAPFQAKSIKFKPLQKENIPESIKYPDFSLLYQQNLQIPVKTRKSKLLEKTASIFKSKSQRFDLKIKEKVPGPGSYYSELELVKSNVPAYSFAAKKIEKTNLIEEIMKTNNYQPIPSIPSNILGYTDEDETCLKPNKLPSNYHTGLGNDKVGPGQYKLKDSYDLRKHKGYTWKKPMFTNKRNDQNNILGPGCYNVSSEIIPLYKYKSSAAFSSNLTRSFDHKEKILVKKQRDVQSNLETTDLGEKSVSKFDEEEIKGKNLGPGSYYDAEKASSIKIDRKPVEMQNFGSSSHRFKSGNDWKSFLGPGKYNPSISVSQSPMKPLVKIPFLSSNERFDNKISNGIPGPGNYSNFKGNPKKATSKLVPSNFGITEKRFKIDKESLAKPGPGTYINPEQKIEKSKFNNYYFKSECDRDIFDLKNENPGSGTYTVDHKTIERNLKDFLEKDPELILKKPAFSSSVTRFTEIKQIENDTEIEDLNAPIHAKCFKPQNVSDSKKEKTINERFKYKTVDGPGPGQYFDANENLWNKKTYNIIFSEV